MNNRQDGFIIRWLQPQDNIIKIKANGSISPHSWGCGGVFRNSKENVHVAFASPLNTCLIIYVKLKIVNTTLKLVFEKMQIKCMD